ncbi:MAG TPA: hypothetical protein VGZ93_09855 [Candidatus Methylacidiphilales bacterium]|jgi:hypothetical protein|nr:hypothetical protein [Candidatus Methylacidiphilales bacterium]
MVRNSFIAFLSGSCALILPILMAAAPGMARASGAVQGVISGQDVNGRAVAVNGKGHYTVVMYTNPDLEDASRKMTLALDPYRSRSDFAFVRVVDLRGDVPPEMRGIVRVQIRKEEAKESARLKKAGVDPSNQAPIIPDFSGSTLNALGWDSVYDQVHLVVYDTHGHEIKRLESVTSAIQMTHVVDSIL